eukprot:scaffold14723_cov282-Ochromonas_danica.AAC.5
MVEENRNRNRGGDRNRKEESKAKRKSVCCSRIWYLLFYFSSLSYRDVSWYSNAHTVLESSAFKDGLAAYYSCARASDNYLKCGNTSDVLVRIPLLLSHKASALTSQL